MAQKLRFSDVCNAHATLERACYAYCMMKRHAMTFGILGTGEQFLEGKLRFSLTCTLTYSDWKV